MPPVNRPSRWEFELETVTPMFLGGCDPNDVAELRVPTLRGALRSWYRLLMGPAVAAGLQDSEGRIRKGRESLVFGGTAPTEGQGTLILSLASPRGQALPLGREEWNPQAGGREGPGSGRSYLGYTLNFGANRRKALPAGTRFTVRSVHPQGLTDLESQRLYLCWWLLINLGGLGSRSRRGFGSLRFASWPPKAHYLDGAKEPVPLPNLPNLHAARRAQDLRDSLKAALAQVIQLSPRNDSGWQADLPLYRLRGHPGSTRVVILGADGDRGWPSAWQALDEVGQRMAEFRRTPGVDGLTPPALATLLDGRPLSRAPARAGFGLPLTYRHLQLRRSFELRPRDGSRMPSPLLLHVCATQAGYFVLLTLLSGNHPGRELDISLKGQDRGYIPAYSNNDAVDRFLTQLPNRLEVRL